MFDKMKQMYELQQKAREIQKKLNEVKVDQTEGGNQTLHERLDEN